MHPSICWQRTMNAVSLFEYVCDYVLYMIYTILVFGKECTDLHQLETKPLNEEAEAERRARAIQRQLETRVSEPYRT